MERVLAARAQNAADVIKHVFSRDSVPYRVRGALSTRRVSYVSRVVVQSMHITARDMFGNPEPSTTLDTAVRDLVDAGHFIWEGPPPPQHERPTIYRLRHRSGVPTRVMAWQPKH